MSSCGGVLLQKMSAMNDAPINESSEFVLIPGNPAPEGAQIVWFEGVGGRRLRACIAPALTFDSARLQGLMSKFS